jgi:hypothetical protein
LAPVALRLARADELEYQLGWECLTWSLQALEREQVRRPDGLLDVVVAAVRPIPPVVSMLFSEIVNHLRAAIDNVMFHVVETLRGGPVPPDAAIQVDMPICQTAAILGRRLDKRRRKLPEFDAGTELFRRIEILQPYSSSAVATAIPAELGALIGQVDLDDVHPLSLLQGYSNGDKHRAIRLASGRTISRLLSQRFGEFDPTMQPVEIGFVLAEGLDHRPDELDTNTGVHVQRPDSQTWVTRGWNSLRSTPTSPRWLSPPWSPVGRCHRTYRGRSAWMTAGSPSSSASRPAGVNPHISAPRQETPGSGRTSSPLGCPLADHPFLDVRR